MVIGIIYGRLRIKKIEFELENSKYLKSKNNLIKSSFKYAFNMAKNCYKVCNNNFDYCNTHTYWLF